MLDESNSGAVGPDSSKISEAPPNRWPPLPAKRILEGDEAVAAIREIAMDRGVQAFERIAAVEKEFFGYITPGTTELLEAFRREAAGLGREVGR